MIITFIKKNARVLLIQDRNMWAVLCGYSIESFDSFMTTDQQFK